MLANHDEILNAALQLPESERLRLVTELLETLPDDVAETLDVDPDFLQELERRANDPSPGIPAADLWKSE